MKKVIKQKTKLDIIISEEKEFIYLITGENVILVSNQNIQKLIDIIRELKPQFTL